jgi:type IV secretory pathway ATPase VirB11/archaellum biosynthesis ATPase
MVERGVVTKVHVSTRKNVSDQLTKALPLEVLKVHRENVGIVSECHALHHKSLLEERRELAKYAESIESYHVMMNLWETGDLSCVQEGTLNF